MVTLKLSPDQEASLRAHGRARNLTEPGEILQALLDTPPPQRRAWTPEELDLLRNPKNSPRALAKTIGRSVQSISVRRNQLAREENIPALQRRPASASGTGPPA